MVSLDVLRVPIVLHDVAVVVAVLSARLSLVVEVEPSVPWMLTDGIRTLGLDNLHINQAQFSTYKLNIRQIERDKGRENGERDSQL